MKFNDSILDDEMRKKLNSLITRLQRKDIDDANSGIDIITRLYSDRAIKDLVEGSGLKLTDSARGELLESMCAKESTSMIDFLNCLVRSTGRTKLAYPNSNYRIEFPKDNEDMFLGLASRVASFISSGVIESDALMRVVAGLSLEDKINFLSWYGLKNKSTKNYKTLAVASKVGDPVIKKAYDETPFSYHFNKTKQDHTDLTPPAKAMPDPASVQEFGSMRDKMVGRTFAIDRLLEKHRHLLNEEQIDAIEDSLNGLRKNIRRLKIATLKDSIKKAAFIAESNNWFEGGMAVRAIAESDEKFVKIASKISNPKEMGEVLDSLREISSFLRQRAIIRELAARDIDVFNLGYGHMTEIGDASAKLMEGFNGAANKIDDLVGKLAAELQQQTAPKTAPNRVRTIVRPEDLPLVKALKPDVEPPPGSVTEIKGEGKE